MKEKQAFVMGLVIGAAAAWLVARFFAAPSVVLPMPAFSVHDDMVRIEKGGAQPMHFEVRAAELGAPLQRPPVTGRVTAVEAHTSPCFAPLDGRIEKSSVALGDHVDKGRRLALIRSGDLASMMRELKANRLSVQTKRALVDRLRVLVETRATSANELTIAQHELEEAELAARAADARLRSLAVAEEGDNLYWVLAPRAGTVVQLEAFSGLEVGPAREKPLATIADLREVVVEADVTQADAVGIRLGASAVISLGEQDPDPLTGKVDTISQVVDPARQTIPVRVRVDNASKRLRPNAFVEVVFDTDAMQSVLRVPTEAVVSDGMRAVVFVETAKGTFQRRSVVVGRQDRGLTEVPQGLNEGDRVVTRGALLLLNALDIEG